MELSNRAENRAFIFYVLNRLLLLCKKAAFDIKTLLSTIGHWNSEFNCGQISLGGEFCEDRPSTAVTDEEVFRRLLGDKLKKTGESPMTKLVHIWALV